MRGTERSAARRAELIAIGRALFADTSYDALSMDDIARQAQVAKGLIYYYLRSKRGYYLAIIQDSVADLVAFAAGGLRPPAVDRVHRTIDGYLRYAEHHQAAYCTIVSGGVGFDAEVHAIRDGVREAIITTIAEGPYGRGDISPLARDGPAVVGVQRGGRHPGLDRPPPAVPRHHARAAGEDARRGPCAPSRSWTPPTPTPPPARRDG